jgi:hypothetical protein
LRSAYCPSAIGDAEAALATHRTTAQAKVRLDIGSSPCTPDAARAQRVSPDAQQLAIDSGSSIHGQPVEVNDARTIMRVFPAGAGR